MVSPVVSLSNYVELWRILPILWSTQCNPSIPTSRDRLNSGWHFSVMVSTVEPWCGLTLLWSKQCHPSTGLRMTLQRHGEHRRTRTRYAHTLSSSLSSFDPDRSELRMTVLRHGEHRRTRTRNCPLLRGRLSSFDEAQDDNWWGSGWQLMGLRMTNVRAQGDNRPTGLSFLFLLTLFLFFSSFFRAGFAGGSSENFTAPGSFVSFSHRLGSLKYG